MSVVFSSRAGFVVQVVDPSVPATLRGSTVVMTPRFDFESHTCIVTKATVGQRANYQFLHTLGSSIYVYSFGDRIGSLHLSGVAFFQQCRGNSSISDLQTATGLNPLDPFDLRTTSNGAARTGLSRALSYYRENKLSKTKTPLKVTLGTGVDTAFRAFLISLTAESSEPGMNLYTFNMELAVVPEK